MININSTVLVGRLTKHPELRKTAQNMSVCQFTLAIDRPFSTNGEKKADFINCVAWKQSADYLNNYAEKGTIVSVEGRIQTRSYDGQNGKVYVTEVVADHVQIISGSRPDQAETEAQDASPEYDKFGGYASGSASSLGITTDELPFY